MINDRKAAELKKSLHREKIFAEAGERSGVIDRILENFKHVDIFYIRSKNPANCVKFLDDDAVIVWDIYYWEIFAKYLTCVINCRAAGLNVTQGVIAEMADFLGSKYSFCRDVARFLKQIPENFSVETQNPGNPGAVQLYTEVAQLFSLFHEMAHIESRRGGNSQILSCRQLVLDMFGALKEEAFAHLGHWAELGKRVAKWDCEMPENIFEEVVSDVFAAIQTLDFLNAGDLINEWKSASCCTAAIDHLFTFQTMFNAVNTAWDRHLPEIMFRLPVRTHEINPYINELAMARYSLGFSLLVTAICSKQRLSKEQRHNLWELRDTGHVDNTGVLACLADEEFICTAIEEAFA